MFVSWGCRCLIVMHFVLFNILIIKYYFKCHANSPYWGVGNEEVGGYVHSKREFLSAKSAKKTICLEFAVTSINDSYSTATAWCSYHCSVENSCVTTALIKCVNTIVSNVNMFMWPLVKTICDLLFWAVKTTTVAQTAVDLHSFHDDVMA